MELQVQIRYADTQEQRSLKQRIRAARQFRSAEYCYVTQAWRQASSFPGGPKDDQSGTRSNDFEKYPGNDAVCPHRARSAVHQGSSRSSPSVRPPANNQEQAESTQWVAISAAEANSSFHDDLVIEADPLSTSTATAHINEPVDTSTAVHEQE